MQTGINIGTAYPKEHVAIVTASINAIFVMGRETGMDQETVRSALQVFGTTVRVGHMTIQDCHISGDKTLNIDMENLEG